MAEYHVGCGLAGIYAGVLNKKKDTWLVKSNVTNEAIDAVMGHMYCEMPDGENVYAYVTRFKNGQYARLMLEVADECPEWAKEQLGVNEEES